MPPMCTLCHSIDNVQAAHLRLSVTTDTLAGPAAGDLLLCETCRCEVWKALHDVFDARMAAREKR